MNSSSSKLLKNLTRHNPEQPALADHGFQPQLLQVSMNNSQYICITRMIICTMTSNTGPNHDCKMNMDMLRGGAGRPGEKQTNKPLQNTVLLLFKKIICLINQSFALIVSQEYEQATNYLSSTSFRI